MPMEQCSRCNMLLLQLLVNLHYQAADGTADQVITTNGSGTLSFATVAGGADWQAVKTTGFSAVVGEGYFCKYNFSCFYSNSSSYLQQSEILLHLSITQELLTLII
jgi:hypothetical protein